MSSFDLEDFRPYADRHRGKYVKSGPHWPLILRFPILFDEHERVVAENTRLRSFIEQLVAKCENPIIRRSQTLATMCRFLDEIHDAGQAALRGGGEG